MIKIVRDYNHYILHKCHILCQIMLFVLNGWHDLTRCISYITSIILLIKIHSIQKYSNAHNRRQDNEGFWLWLPSSRGSYFAPQNQVLLSEVKNGTFTFFELVGSLPLTLNQNLTLGTEIWISGIEKDEFKSKNRVKLKKQWLSKSA